MSKWKVFLRPYREKLIELDHSLHDFVALLIIIFKFASNDSVKAL